MDTKIMIGIPVKDSKKYLPTLLAEIRKLTFPKENITLCFMESDSQDGTYEYLCSIEADLKKEFRKVIIKKKDFAFKIAKELRHSYAYFTYWTYGICLTDIVRQVKDEEYILFLTDNIRFLPENIIEKFLEDGKEILGPVLKPFSDFIVISSKRFELLSQIPEKHKAAYAHGIPAINYRTEKDLPPPYNQLEYPGLDPEYFKETRVDTLIEVDYVCPVHFVKTSIFKEHPEITYEPLIFDIAKYGQWVVQVPLSFCLKARLAGYKLYIDLSLECIEG